MYHFGIKKEEINEMSDQVFFDLCARLKFARLSDKSDPSEE